MGMKHGGQIYIAIYYDVCETTIANLHLYEFDSGGRLYHCNRVPLVINTLVLIATALSENEVIVLYVRRSKYFNYIGDKKRAN
jgi:hypothetical protein